MTSGYKVGLSLRIIRDARLLTESWFELIRAMIAIRLHPSLVASDRHIPVGRRPLASPSVDEVCLWVARAAAHHIKRVTCLERAVAAQRMLRRRGFPADLHIGVRPVPPGFEAHAWLTLDGRSLDPQSDAFTAMKRLSAAQRNGEQNG